MYCCVSLAYSNATIMIYNTLACHFSSCHNIGPECNNSLHPMSPMVYFLCQGISEWQVWLIKVLTHYSYLQNQYILLCHPQLQWNSKTFMQDFRLRLTANYSASSIVQQTTNKNLPNTTNQWKILNFSRNLFHNNRFISCDLQNHDIVSTWLKLIKWVLLSAPSHMFAKKVEDNTLG